MNSLFGFGPFFNVDFITLLLCIVPGGAFIFVGVIFLKKDRESFSGYALTMIGLALLTGIFWLPLIGF